MWLCMPGEYYFCLAGGNRTRVGNASSEKIVVTDSGAGDAAFKESFLAEPWVVDTERTEEEVSEVMVDGVFEAAE
jgi:hypothetical protein